MCSTWETSCPSLQKRCSVADDPVRVRCVALFWSEADHDKSTDYHHHHVHHPRQTAAAEERTSATATWTHTDALCCKFFSEVASPNRLIQLSLHHVGEALGFDVADVPSGKRLRHNMADLFLTNSVSATRAASLFSDAAAASAEGVGDLERVGAPKHHHHRNMLRKLLQKVKVAKALLRWNRHSEQEEVASVPFL